MGTRIASVAGVGVLLSLGLLAWWLSAGSEPAAPRGAALGSAEATARAETSPHRRDTARDDVPPVAAPAAPSAAVALTAPAHAARDAASDQVGLVLYGALLDCFGARVDADVASVRIQGFDGESRWQRCDNGTFAFAGIAPGSWQLATSATGYRKHEQTVELDVAEPVRRLDIVLERAVVLPVRLRTPAGESLEDAMVGAGESSWMVRNFSVVATRERPERDLPLIDFRAYRSYDIGTYSSRFESAFTDDDIPTGAHGVLQIDQPLPAWVSLVARHVVMQSQQVPPGAEEIVFVLPVGAVHDVLSSLRLRVVEAQSGEPMPGADVVLSTSQGGGSPGEADANGEVTFRGSMPGLLELRISAEGHGDVERVVELPAGAELDLGDLPLDPATQVRGRIVDADGAPHAVLFQVHPLERFAEDHSLHSRRSYRSSGDGSFVVRGLGRGLFVLRAVDDAWAGAQLVDARHGDVDGAMLVVQPPTAVALRMPWPSETTLPLLLFDAAGNPVKASRSVVGGRTWSVKLAPGDYQALVGSDARTDFKVGTNASLVELTY